MKEPPRDSSSPQSGRYSFYWNEGNANPWKGRDYNDFQHSKADLAWTILTDEGWWLAVWDDIVETHGEETASRFWRSYWTTEAIEAREKTRSGEANFNWSEAVVAFTIANHEEHQAEIAKTAYLDMIETNPEHREFLLSKINEKANGPEAVAAHKRNLGDWLYRVIREKKAGHLDKLAKLIRGTTPPKSAKTNREKWAALDGFTSLVLRNRALPTIADLRKTQDKWNDFRETRETLGLSNLPRAKPGPKK